MVQQQGTVQSVERALKILVTLAEASTALSLSEIRNRTGLNISTAHRLLHTLMKSGFVGQDKSTGKYLLGLRTFEVGHAALHSLDIRDTARPVLKELVDHCNETTNLSVLDNDEIVYIDQIESSNLIKIFARIGSRGPIYCTGAGKAMMSLLTERELESYLQRNMPLKRFTSRTITDPDKIKQELERAKIRGYALDQGELEEGVRCVASPIYDFEGRPVACVSVSGPDIRLTDTFVTRQLVPAVHSAAAKISEKLGYRNHR